MDILAKLKALDEQRSKIVEEAKAEALQEAHKAIAALNSLGFHYSLKEGNGPQRVGSPKTEGTKRQSKDIACPICNFKTSPLHDGRAHRRQQTKKPFTAAELTERGLAKVD
jgi:hypothetical protein